MLTPDDIQKKMFSLGRKLENNDVGVFVKEVQINYQLIYDQVIEQEKQIKGMEKKLKYYRDVEANLQDALVHAEKVSDQKIKDSQHEAEKIEAAAHKKAENIIADAKSELVYLKSIIKEFEKVYDNYQDKYKDFVQGQLKFINDSKQFMEKEKIHVKKFVSNIDVEDYSASSYNNENKQRKFTDRPNQRNESTYGQRNKNLQIEPEGEEDDTEGFNNQNINEKKEEVVGTNQKLKFDDVDEQSNDMNDFNEEESDYGEDNIEDTQESNDNTNTYGYDNVIKEQELSSDNQVEVEMESNSLEENIDDENEMMKETGNIDDMFTLPEIDMDSLDFSSLNFGSSSQNGGVDFNSTLNSTSQVTDQVDMPMQDEGYSYDQEFDNNSNYNYGNQNGYGVNTINDVENVGDTTKSNVPNMEADDDLDNRVPDLSQNANVELKFANDSFFGKKKKIDGKEKILQSMNLGGTKSDEKARIRQLENSYAQDMLNANKQVAGRGPIESDGQDANQHQSSRNYGPTNFNPENKGLASKPLNPGGQEQQRRTLFSLPGDK